MKERGYTDLQQRVLNLVRAAEGGVLDQDSIQRGLGRDMTVTGSVIRSLENIGVLRFNGFRGGALGGSPGERMWRGR